MRKAPGKAHRGGVTLIELAELFPDEEAARKWFEARIWPDGRKRPRGGGSRTREATHKTMPYWCADCRQYFSVKVGTVMEASNLPLRKWAYAIYLHLTSRKGVSSMQLHRDIGIAQNSAWHMLKRIRRAFEDGDVMFLGPGGSRRDVRGRRGAQQARHAGADGPRRAGHERQAAPV